MKRVKYICLIVAIMALGLLLYGRMLISAEEVGATDYEIETTEQSEEPGKGDLESSDFLPEISVVEVTAGFAYDIEIKNVEQADYDDIIIKVWNDQEYGNNVETYKAEWQRNRLWFCHVPISNDLPQEVFHVEAYGVTVNESAGVESIDQITISMLEDKTIAKLIGETSFIL